MWERESARVLLRECWDRARKYNLGSICSCFRDSTYVFLVLFTSAYNDEYSTGDTGQNSGDNKDDDDDDDEVE